MRLPRQPRHPDVEVAMTPLIDVTFLLLVFFMVVSAFNQMERNAELELPAAYQATIEKDVAKERMVINIEADGTIILYGKSMDVPQLRRNLKNYGPCLRALGQRTGEAPVVVRGDRDCPYREIKKVLSAVYDEGFTKVMFAAYEKRPDERRATP